MRGVGFVLLAVAPAAVVWLLLSNDRPHQAARSAGTEDPIARARIERLENDLDALRREVRDARSELSSLRGAILATAPPQGPEGAGVGSYLDEYARSFEAGGTGSEYFRLVVEAYAPSLRDAILRRIADADAPLALRARLIAMLARAEFRGDGRVIESLIDVLRSSPQLAQPVVQTLRAIGDGRTGATLEALALDLLPPARGLAVVAAVDLAGAGANGAVVRLLGAARDAATKGTLIQQLRSGDDVHAAQALRDASRMDVPVRIQAAQKLGTFRGEVFTRLLDDWLGYESDENVRRELEKAREQQSNVPNWHALKATGPPDAVPATQDNRNAWATSEQDKGLEWIELTYDPPRRASSVRIFEVNVAGGVVEVETVDEGGTRRSVWKGSDPTVTPGVFDVSFSPTGYRVQAVRIILDTSKLRGWEEIDAVELVGPDGRGWAKGASASSIYGQG